MNLVQYIFGVLYFKLIHFKPVITTTRWDENHIRERERERDLLAGLPCTGEALFYCHWQSVCLTDTPITLPACLPVRTRYVLAFWLGKTENFSS